jgi:hypothetical protein
MATFILTLYFNASTNVHCMVKHYKFILRKIKCRIVMEKAAFNKKTPFASELDLNLREKQ